MLVLIDFELPLGHSDGKVHLEAEVLNYPPFIGGETVGAKRNGAKIIKGEKESESKSNSKSLLFPVLHTA